MYSIFENDKFELIRLELNKKEINGVCNFPKNGTLNGIERTDDASKTTNYIIPIQHPTENKGFITQWEGMPQIIKDNHDYELTRSQMIQQGYFPAELTQ